MNWKKWLENWDMTSLKIKTPFLDMDWNPQEEDKDAAWEMYIELITRITTQGILPDQGDEKAALQSIYQLFGITRNIIREHGRDCSEFTKIAVLVLNQIIRPFTSKWHKLSFEGAFDDEKKCSDFRTELADLQTELKKYTKMLSDMADVEDITELNGE